MTWVQRNLPHGSSASRAGMGDGMGASHAGADPWSLDDFEFPNHPELEAVRLAKSRLRGLFAARPEARPGPVAFLRRHPEAAALGAVIAGAALTRSGAARSAALGWAGRLAALWLRARLAP